MTPATGRRRVLLVLGMHRSGTSATTRVANLLGANLGDKLVEPAPDNPDGFWEHADAVRIDEALLEGLGRTWYDMREMPTDWQDGPAAHEAYEQIEALIRGDFPADALWAIKDPRMCLTAPLWIRAAEAQGYEVDCLFVVRDPSEVVRSLHARNDWAQAPLYLMWVQYLMEAEAATRRCRRSLITYDELLGDWRATMGRVASELDFTWPDGELAEAEQAVDAFLDSGRRHHIASPHGDGTNAGASVPALAEKLYQACLWISRGEQQWDAVAQLQMNYRSVAELFAEHVDQLLKQRWNAEGRALVAEARVAEQQAAAENVAELEKLVGDVSLTVAKNHDLLAGKLDDINGSLRGRIDELGHEFERQQQELLELSHREREQEVANKSRLEAIDARLRVYLDSVGESHSGLVDRVRQHLEAADTRLQARLGVFEESGARMADQMQKSLEAINARLQARLDVVEESGAKVAGQMQQGLEAVDARLQAHARSRVSIDSDIAARLQQIDAANAQLRQSMQTVEDAYTVAAGRIDRHLEGISAELRSQMGNFRSALSDKDTQIRDLAAELAQRDASMRQLTRSASWRITAPLRWMKRAVSLGAWKRRIGHGTKTLYDKLPMPAHRRLALKGMVFRTLAPLIRNTQSYRAWRAYEAQRGASHHTASRSAPPHAGAAPSVSLAAVQADTKLGTSADLAAKVLGGLHAAAEGVTGEYVAMDETSADFSRIDVRAIAFYLPQFHPIPENDEWWGRGFTEWTNVTKAVPQFVGHYQPRLPGELGFYDLRVVDVMRRQVELARHYGLQGFCFHYYWFGGRRLLERPLEQFVTNKDIDFPFCICWANENWSRRWDGMDQDILIGQNHSPEDDIAFITALEPLLRDPRYIRVDGKPLIVLYRPSILPDAKATQQRWREYCRKSGIGEIVLAMVQFDVEDPRVFGFDVAIEFPPHKLARGLDPMNDKLHIVNPDYSGYVVDYNAVIERASEHSAVDFDMIRGVFPSWDNEARKPGRGYTFANATPERYREWLDLAVDYARKHPVAGERMVFINAWNEWAEGAHLEPDRRYGYAWLSQTRAALTTRSASTAERIVVVSHDAHPHGAQYLALNMVRSLKQTFHYGVDLVLLGPGVLKEEFGCWARVHDLSGKDPQGEEARTLAVSLYETGARRAIANTTVSGFFARTLKSAGFTVVGLVHELPGVLRDNGLERQAISMACSVDRLVFPADTVKQGFLAIADVPAPRAVIRRQGLYKLNRFASEKARLVARRELRNRLGLAQEARIVLCVGYADHRKGVDLFVDLAKRLAGRDDLVHFVWVGHFDTRFEPRILDLVRDEGLQGRVHFTGRESDTDVFYAGSDVYALTSREDPFPSVVMESLQVALPVIGFAGAGGFTELLAEGCGICVPMEDMAAFEQAVASLLSNPDDAQVLGKRGRALVEEQFSFRGYMFDLLAMLGIGIPRVSVVVPNYNYAHLLPERLASIANQTLPFFELIVLDDCSSDDSLNVIEEFGIRHSLHVRCVSNDRNSGSVFRQWYKGMALARGKYVWIAEADDLAEPSFLATLVAAMSDSRIVLGYSQSKQMDEGGRIIADNYLEYTRDVSEDRWQRAYCVPGTQEITECLAIKNTIPNVSAVVFRRDALQRALEDQLRIICSFRIAGDWITYLAVLEQGYVAFVPEALNLHRRHGASVTLGGDYLPHMREVLRVQAIVRQRYLPDRHSAAKADAYVDHLCTHFGMERDVADGLLRELSAEVRF